MARDRYGADWIIYGDVDEFVCTHGKSLRTVLAESDRDGITLLNLPRRTMTGPLIPPGRRATEVLTLRIDRTVVPTAEQTIHGISRCLLRSSKLADMSQSARLPSIRSPAGCIPRR